MSLSIPKSLDVLTASEGYVVGYTCAKYNYSLERVVLVIRKSKVLAKRRTISMRETIANLLMEGKIMEAEAKLNELERQYSNLLTANTKKTISPTSSDTKSTSKDIRVDRPLSRRRSLSSSSLLPPPSSRRREDSKTNLLKTLPSVRKAISRLGSAKSTKSAISKLGGSLNNIEDVNVEFEEIQQVVESDTPRSVDSSDVMRCAICNQHFTSDFAFRKHREFSSLHQLNKDKQRNRLDQKRRMSLTKPVEILTDKDLVPFFEGVKSYLRLADKLEANVLVKVFEVPAKKLFCVLPVDIDGTNNTDSLPVFFFKMNALEVEVTRLQPNYPLPNNEDDFTFDQASRQAKYDKIAAERKAIEATNRRVELISQLIISSFVAVPIKNGFTLEVLDKFQFLLDTGAADDLAISPEEIRRATSMGLSLRDCTESLQVVDDEINAVKQTMEDTNHHLDMMEEILNSISSAPDSRLPPIEY